MGNKKQFVDAITRVAEGVWDFHEMWGFTYEQRNKGRKDIEVFNERVNINIEEVKELVLAIQAEDTQNIDEEMGDVLWVAMGNLLSVSNEDARERVADLVVMENGSKNHQNYAIREDTGKLISIHKPEKWIGAEEQLKKEWEERGMLIEEGVPDDSDAPTVKEAMMDAMAGLANKPAAPIKEYVEKSPTLGPDMKEAMGSLIN